MENIESIEQVLENLDNNIVYKKKDSVIRGIMFMLSGIVLLIAYISFEWEKNNLFANSLFIVGSVCFIVGIFGFFIRKSRYVSAQNQQKMKSFDIYFHVNERDKLIRLLGSENLSEIKQLKPSIVDGLKLRIMGTKDGLISYSQVVAYISNEYVQVTTPVKHTPEDYFMLTEIVDSRK